MNLSSNKFISYLFAIIVSAAGIVIRLYLSSTLGNLSPFSMSIIAVVLSSWFGGLMPGLLATFISAVASHYFFIEPYHHIIPDSPKSVVQICSFIIICLTISLFSAQMHLARRKLQQRGKQLESEIRERELMQAALRYSEQRYRNVFNQQFQFMAILSPDGILLEVNDLLLQAAGLTREEVLGKLFWQTAWWEGLPEIQKNWPHRLKQAAQSNYPILSDDPYVAIGGQVRSADAAVTAVKDENNKISFFIVQATDNSERKATELALRESETKFRQIANTMPQIVWSTDPDGYHDFFNDRWYSYTGMSHHGSQGWNWKDYLHPDDYDRALQAWQHSLASGTPYEINYRLKSMEGQYRWFIARALPVTDNNGKITRWFGTCTDTTDLYEAIEKAEAASRAKSEFLANMSHEIRTPMNAVVGLASLLQSDNLSPAKQKEFITTIQLSAQSLMSLINDLLDISKLESRQVELEHIPFNLKEVIDDVINMMDIKAKERNIGLQVDLDGLANANFMGDPLRLRQVILNLASNGIKFTEQGSVQISAVMSDIGRLQIKISDTGIGIPKDKLENVFSKFSQADTSITRKYGGTGLGLSICKNLVELMEGDLSVTSQLGQGSVFTVELPLQAA